MVTSARAVPGAQRPGDEPLSGRQVTPFGEQDVDDLAILVPRPVQARPRAGGLEVGLIGGPPVTGSVAAGAGGLDEFGGEALDPPVDGEVIDGDAALSQQLFHVAAAQAIAQVSADGQGDHLPRETEASERRRQARRRHQISLPAAEMDQRNNVMPTPEACRRASSVPLINGRILARCIPRARLHVIDGGGHLFLLEQPAEIARLIATFLRSEPPRSRPA